MVLYEKQFLEAYDFPAKKPEKFLVIASTPRCGSHMLGHTLYETGRFGFPLEYAQPANLAEWRRICGTTDTESTIEAIMRRRTSSNGVFSIKLHYSHLEVLGGFAGVRRLFPAACFVLLTRHQVLKQAVSLAIAGQTGVWIDGQEPDEEAKTPVYDHHQIEACLRRVLRDNASWRYLLEANGCNYLDLDFDVVKKEMPGTVERIARFAGVSLAGAEVPDAPVTRRQASTINTQWAERFIAEQRGGVLFPREVAPAGSSRSTGSWFARARRMVQRSARGV